MRCCGVVNIADVGEITVSFLLMVKDGNKAGRIESPQKSYTLGKLWGTG